MTEERVGFTGSRLGMTAPQANTISKLLTGTWLHHGDCVGGDFVMHHMAIKRGMKVSVHPPINPSLRAFCVGDVVHEPKDYIPRNHDIVDDTHRMIAAPSSMTEERRSGTWATVRYARRRKKPVVVVLPDGSVA